MINSAESATETLLEWLTGGFLPVLTSISFALVILVSLIQRVLKTLRRSTEHSESALLKALEARASETAIETLQPEVVEATVAIETPTAPPPVDVDTVVQERVDQAVQALAGRLKEIEARFPAQDQIDKVASVNDAILATRIEAIQASIERLEDKLKETLSKWDVALVVLQTLGGIGVIVGIILGLIKFATGG